MSPNSSSEPLCPDWVFSNNSNVHACKNRGWFTDYTPFESFAGTLYTNDKIPVLGVGTVILLTKKTPGRGGRGNHGQLVLHDVLHIPSGICNIIGLTEGDRNNLAFSLGRSSKSSGTIKDTQGQSIAYLDASKTFLQVKLSGPPVGPIVGPSAFNKPNTLYILNVRWAQSELTRWKECKQGNQSRTSHTSEHSPASPKKNTVRHPQPNLGYTEEEKSWLRIHYSNEWEFLRAYGLSIFDDEEREEGRRMLRAFMAEEAPLGKAFVEAEMASGQELEDHDWKDGDSKDDGEESDGDHEGNMVD